MFPRLPLSSLSLRALNASKPAGVPLAFRWYAVRADEDVRAKLMEGMKEAMKAKDSAKSTILRSMLSEVYDADKKKQEKIATPVIQSLIQKAVQRRRDAAKQYISGSRPDLAEKEEQEIIVLNDYLPPLLSPVAVEEALQKAIAEQLSRSGDGPAKVNAGATLGKVIKAFYTQVDKASVDGAYVKKRAEELIKEAQK